MRKQCLLLGAVCLMSTSALAFSGISAKYDGKYRGTGEVAVKSPAACAPVAFNDVTIKAGHLSSGSSDLHIDGFITEEGYIDASMKPADGAKAKMDGRLQGEAISAGAIDQASGCAWIVRLQKAD